MSLPDLFRPITTFVFDMDGVLTDGSLTLMPGGVMARRMNTKDGYALQLAIRRGYKIAIISGGFSDEATDRLNKLGVTSVYMKVADKLSVLDRFIREQEITWEEVLYMGDDIPDLLVMTKSGMACCPLDAVAEIKAISAYISPVIGGSGCCRDVIEKVLKIRGDWNEDVHIQSK